MPPAPRRLLPAGHVRALELLRDSGDAGCTESLLMVAHSIEVRTIAELLASGLARGAIDRVGSDGSELAVRRFRITPKGRKAIESGA